jgi:hypothetical protein
MSYIKLEKLVVSGSNVTTSTIEFGKKLTIIAGPSDTGKSYIYKCIDYVLGAKNDDKHRPLDIQEGYDTIDLFISTNQGNIKLTRKLNSDVTVVESENENIESGEYVLKEKKTNTKTTNSLMLKIINIPDNIKLPKNKKGDSSFFTWRTIKHAFMIDEQEADKSESVLTSPFGQTLFFAALIYLINEDELSEYKSDEESETIRKAKRNAVIGYIKKQRELLEEKKSKFEDLVQNHTNEKSLDEQIQDLNNQLEAINQAIDTSTLRNKEISTAMIPVQSRLSRNKATISRYDELKSQYNTDIERLTFIVENELLVTNATPNTKCPFCENNIEPHDHSSYIEASQAELVKLVTNLNDLENTKIEIKNQVDDDESLVKDYKEQLDEIRKILKEELIPQRNQISNLLKNYKERIQIEGALAQFKDFDLRFEEDIKEYEKTPESKYTPFDGKKLLYDLIHKGIEKNAKSILKSVGYTPLDSVIFDEKSLDLIVNGKLKNTHGKGYMAFFNSTLLLSLMNFITELSNKNPGLYIFDSPLKGLTLSEEIINDHNIREGYFKYLVELETTNQIIVMENTDNSELPKISSDKNTKIYEFTQVEGKGRYGFLESVKRK